VGGTALPAPTSSFATFEAFFFDAVVPARGFAGDEADFAVVFAFPFTAGDFFGEAVFAAGFADGFADGDSTIDASDFFLEGIVLPRCFAEYNPLVLLDLTRAGHSLKRCGFFTYPPSGRGPS
jgi:hypothetical protein